MRYFRVGMADELEDQGWARLGVAAALGREYAADSRAFLPFLVKLLQSAMPDETAVRTQGLFKKSVVGVSLDLGGTRYTIDDPGRGPLVAARTQVVRGIALKTEAIAMPECLAELEAALEARAAENARARSALAGMLGLE